MLGLTLYDKFRANSCEKKQFVNFDEVIKTFYDTSKYGRKLPRFRKFPIVQ